jgi:hypothetical protein
LAAGSLILSQEGGGQHADKRTTSTAGHCRGGSRNGRYHPKGDRQGHRYPGRRRFFAVLFHEMLDAPLAEGMASAGIQLWFGD